MAYSDDIPLPSEVEELPQARSERVPPHSVATEQQVLGAMMLNRQAISRVVALVDQSAFHAGRYGHRHRQIFNAVVSLYERSEPVDLPVLTQELERRGILDECGGPAYLADIAASVGTSANVEYHARQLLQLGIRRKTITLASQLAVESFDTSNDIYEKLETFEHDLFNLAEHRWRQGFSHIEPIMHRTYERIERVSRYQGEVSGVPSGFEHLDRLTAGFQRGEFIVVAGRPGMGKTALVLNVALRAAVGHRQPVGIFSLEMSGELVAQRLLCTEAHVDGQLVRTGRLNEMMWNRLSKAVGTLTDAPIYIDDSPNLSPLEVRAKGRRLVHEHSAQLLIVDYLQLMRLPFRVENRAQEVGEISQSLKALAKDLDIPIIACSQVTREVEKRGDTRPKLSDLRESGCLAGEALVYLPDEGTYRRIDELEGRQGFNVLAVNRETWKLERRTALGAFTTGVKPTFRLTTRLGHSIRATANHRFLTLGGWTRFDHLTPGSKIALPRSLPDVERSTVSNGEAALVGHLIGDGCTLPRHVIQYTTSDACLAQRVATLATRVFGDAIKPRICKERDWYQVYLPATNRLTHGKRNAISVWLDEMGIFGLRSWEKCVPERFFTQSNNTIAAFLRHLWSTDGCVKLNGDRKPTPSIYYATSSPQLAQHVQALLLRLGITATRTRVAQGSKGRDQYHVVVYGKPDLMRFLDLVGTVGENASRNGIAIRLHLATRAPNTNRDVIPREAWRLHVVPAMQSIGMTTRQLHAGINTSYCGATLYKSGMGRERAERVARTVGSAELLKLAQSEVYWDEVVSIEPEGEAKVYDLTVEGLHNFIAENIIVHNSIEQDADVVMFVHRPEYYRILQDEQGRSLEGVAEILVEKQRNGPTGKVLLRWFNQYGLFEPLAPEEMEPAPEGAKVSSEEIALDDESPF